MKKPLLVLSLLFLSGCAPNLFSEVGKPPQLSPVGEGLRTNAYAMPAAPRVRTPVSFRSTWDDGTDLYRDPRAQRVGDIVTVVISMQDKAKLDNKTDRSRDSQIKFGLDFLANLGGLGDSGKTTANLNS